MQFSEADKENRESQYASDEVAIPVKGIPDDLPEPVAKKIEAETVKEEDSEIEPILQENPQRFVLFPIKYHEVSQRDATRTRKVVGGTRAHDFSDMEHVQEGRGIILDCRRD